LKEVALTLVLALLGEMTAPEIESRNSIPGIAIAARKTATDSE
jgi:hypothetical protein